LPIPHDQKITSIVPVTEFLDDEYLVMLTTKGYIKKTALAAFGNIRTNGLIAITLEEGDQLRWVRRAREQDSIIVGSSLGRSIHFRANHEQLRPLGRATRGVRSMSLRDGDSLVGMDILPSQIVADLAQALESEVDLEDLNVDSSENLTSGNPTSVATLESEVDLEDLNGDNAELPPSLGPWVLVVTNGGYGKRVPMTQFRLQKRAGMGLVAIKFRKAGDRLAALRIVNEGEELMIVTNRGIIIRQSVDAISSQSRSATGVRVQRLDDDDAIAAVALVPQSNEEEVALLEEGEETTEE
jgi:DNA gyrase subunit A